MASKKSNRRAKVQRKVRRETEKAIKKVPTKVKVALFLVLLVAVAAFLLYWNYYVDPLENWFNRENVQISLEKAEGDLRVHFVDVGQGDGIVIEFPDGKNMVIDAGPRNAKNKMLGYLRALNIKKVDYAVLTHADEDHVGSMDDVIGDGNIDVANVYRPGIETDEITTTVYKQFMTALDNEIKEVGCVEHITDNDSDINGGSYYLDFFANAELYGKVKSNSTAEKKNAVSPFIFLQYAGAKVLFTGDANFDSEKWLLAQPEVAQASDAGYFDVDVLKVGHHGSATSTGEDFLKLVQPEHAVISCGEGNKYGHPRAEALERLNAAGVAEQEIYRTDQRGDIILTISPHADGESAELQFHTEKQTAATGAAYTVIAVRSEQADWFVGLYIGLQEERKAA